MVASCVVRSGARLAWSDSLGKDVEQAGAVIYDGPCSLLPIATQGRAGFAGGEPVESARYALKIPWHVEGVRAGHTATVTSPDPDGQPARVTVVEVGGGDMVTCRRLVVERMVDRAG